MTKASWMSRMVVVSLLGSLMSACGGGGGNAPVSIVPPPPPVQSAPAAPVASLSIALKRLNFSWTSVAGATSYRLFRNADGASGFTQVGADIAPISTTVSLDVPVHLVDWLNARYQVHACNQIGCTPSADLSAMSGYQQAAGYFKASNTNSGDSFGGTVALSRDGRTMAVGAVEEDSASQMINGDQADNTASNAGAVYVFSRSAAGIWTQQAYVKGSNTEAGDLFGRAVALSADGNTLAVGASGEDSFATGVGGNSLDNTASAAGAAYVFTRSGDTWTQQAYIKASNTEAQDAFGYRLAISASGDRLAVGAFGEDSSADGIDGNQNTNLASAAGAVYVFARVGAAWSQQAYVKASNSGANRQFGSALALSSDGQTLAVGAYSEDSGATGINGNQSNNNAPNSGAAYVFVFSGNVWTQQAYIKASRSIADLVFGYALALSGDGNTLAVGTYNEGSAATGVDGNQDDTSAPLAGAVYVFARSVGVWQQQSYVKASNAEASDFFGRAVALDDSGNTLAVGAHGEDSLTGGVNGNQLDNSGSGAGAVYVLTRVGQQWKQRSYLKPNVAKADNNFGLAISFSGDGETLAVGYFDDSAAMGIGGNANDVSAASYAGAVQLY
jgi:hypothetical protein